MKLLETIAPNFTARRAAARFEAARYQAAVKMLEGIPTFAQDTDEGKWEIVGSAGKTPADYNEYDFRTARVNARKMYYADPGARGVIEAIVNHVIGRDCTVTAKDEAPEVQEYWEDWSEFNNWDMRAKESFRRLLRDGEYFLRKFEPVGQGKYEQLRFIEPAEIINPNGIYGWGIHSFGIECDPNDVETPLFYYRKYAVNNTDHWERILAEEIIHVKIMVDSDVKRGMSFLIGISEYFTKYKSWLDDRIRLNKIRNLFSLVAKPQGAAAASKLKSQFADVTGKTPTGGTAKKQLPKPGSVLIAKGVDWKYESLNIDASDTKDDGRAIELMISKGANLPEYISRGDASNANYASTSVSESPFVKAMEAWQDVTEKPFKRVFKERIEYAKGKTILPENSEKTNVEIINGKEIVTTEKVPTDTGCTINFPTLVHRDVEGETKALILQNNQKLVSKDTASGRLGYDYKEEKQKIEKEEIDADERTKINFGINTGAKSNGEKENPDDE